MLCIKVKKYVLLSLMIFAVSSVLCATESYALFEGLTGAGSKIFEGMRDIIYAAAGFGIIAIAIGGFFGNLNWKWLSAVIIGLFVIAVTAGILSYMTDGYSSGAVTIQDTMNNLITAE